MDKVLLKKLLEKYSRGTCTPDEAAVIESWLATVKNTGPDACNSIEDNELDLIKLNINNYLFLSNRKLKSKSSYLYAAASVIVVAGCLGWFWFKPKEVVIAAKRPQTERYIKNGFVYIETPKGIRQDINLSDGSRVTIDAATRFHYPARFTGRSRPVF